MRGPPPEPTAHILFQQAIAEGRLPLKAGATDPTLYFALDQANGKNRFSCFRYENGVVTAFVTFVQLAPRDGKQVLQIGYEVPEHLRGQGRAKEAVTASLVELQHFMNVDVEFSDFIVEAIIDNENVASQHVASACISATPDSIVDAFTGRPSRQYVKHFATGDMA